MTAVPVEHGLILAAVLFSLGLAGLLTRRNLIMMLLCLEIMLNSAGIAFVLAASKWGQPDGQVMFLFILAVSASEAAVGLGLVVQFFHRAKTTSIDAMGRE
jgi:NADH-quinone oxidoreductase subunit K